MSAFGGIADMRRDTRRATHDDPARIIYAVIMPNDQGYEIRHNGVPRTFRDNKATAYEAARFAKNRHPADIIAIVDCSTGTKSW